MAVERTRIIGDRWFSGRLGAAFRCGPELFVHWELNSCLKAME